MPQLLLLIPLALAASFAYHFVPWRWHAEVASWPIWLRGLAAFVIADLGFYWGHRWAHEIPLLWRFHAVHHDPRHVYFLISARAHPVDNAFIRLCGLVPIYILGLGAPQSVQGTMIATLLMLLVTFWGFFIHANVRWRFGPLEWLVSTPAFHLWHHTLDRARATATSPRCCPAGTGCSAPRICRAANSPRIMGSTTRCRRRAATDALSVRTVLAGRGGTSVRTRAVHGGAAPLPGACAAGPRPAAQTVFLHLTNGRTGRNGKPGPSCACVTAIFICPTSRDRLTGPSRWTGSTRAAAIRPRTCAVRMC